MPNLKYEIRLGGNSEQLLRLIYRGGNRLLDKNVNAAF